GQRRGDPAGLQGVARIRARAHLLQPEVLSRLYDGRADLLVFRVRTPDLESRLAGHAVAQAPHLAAPDVDDAHVEEPDLGRWTAVELREDLFGIRPLDLEPVVPAMDGVAA